MNTLDIILLICFVPAIFRGISKGFIRQAAALVGIVVGVWASWHYGVLLESVLKPALELPETAIKVISFAAIFLVCTLLAALLGWAVASIFKLATLGWMDKALGVLFAILVTAVILGVLIVLFNTLDAKFDLPGDALTEGSVVYKTLKDIAYTVFPYLKGMLLAK
jgi:membrane protein required for colicin V production